MGFGNTFSVPQHLDSFSMNSRVLRRQAPRRPSWGAILASTFAVAVITGFGAHILRDAQASEKITSSSESALHLPNLKESQGLLATAAFLDVAPSLGLPAGLQPLTLSFNEPQKLAEIDAHSVVDMMSIQEHGGALLAEQVKVIDVKRFADHAMVTVAVLEKSAEQLSKTLTSEKFLFVPRGSEDESRWKSQEVVASLKTAPVVTNEEREPDFIEIAKHPEKTIEFDAAQWEVLK